MELANHFSSFKTDKSQGTSGFMKSLLAFLSVKNSGLYTRFEFNELHIFSSEGVIEDLITKIRVTYDDSIIDDGVWDDIAAITIKYLFYADEYFKKKQENSLSYYDREQKMLNFFEDYKEHCLAYRSDGKKKGFFSGIIFMKSEKIDNKEENFFKRTEKFLEQKF